MLSAHRSHIDTYFKEVEEIIRTIDRQAINTFITMLESIKEEKGRLFILGVGGSAANSSHAVNDFRKICGIESYAPSDNVAELTARINDEGWDSSLVEWLKISNFSKKDVVLILSVGGGTSTTSQNLVKAMEYSRQCGGKILSIVSRDGGVAKKISDCCVHIPVINLQRVTPHAEEWQGIIWHLVVNCLVQKGEL